MTLHLNNRSVNVSRRTGSVWIFDNVRLTSYNVMSCGGSKITKVYKDLFGSAPYSGRSSSIKPSCSKTELNHCTTTEIRWKKTKMLEHPWSSPPIAYPTRPRTEEHPCWLGCGTSLQSGQIHPVMRVQHTWPPCSMPTRLQRLPRKMKLPGTSRQWCKTPWHPIWETCLRATESVSTHLGIFRRNG